VIHLILHACAVSVSSCSYDRMALQKFDYYYHYYYPLLYIKYTYDFKNMSKTRGQELLKCDFVTEVLSFCVPVKRPVRKDPLFSLPLLSSKKKFPHPYWSMIIMDCFTHTHTQWILLISALFPQNQFPYLLVVLRSRHNNHSISMTAKTQSLTSSYCEALTVLHVKLHVYCSLGHSACCLTSVNWCFRQLCMWGLE